FVTGRTTNSRYKAQSSKIKDHVPGLQPPAIARSAGSDSSLPFSSAGARKIHRWIAPAARLDSSSQRKTCYLAALCFGRRNSGGTTISAALAAAVPASLARCLDDHTHRTESGS